MAANKSTATVEKADPIVLAQNTMTGDLRDFILDRLKNDHSALPWNTRREAEQRETIASVERAVRATVARAVEIIAADGRQVLKGTLVKVLVKDGIKTQIDLLQSDPLRHKLIDHQGGTVLVALATLDDLDGERAPAEVNKDQSSLLDDGNDADEPVDE